MRTLRRFGPSVGNARRQRARRVKCPVRSADLNRRSLESMMRGGGSRHFARGTRNRLWQRHSVRPLGKPGGFARTDDIQLQQFTMSVKQNVDNATRASQMADSPSTTAKTRDETFYSVLRMMGGINDGAGQIGQNTVLTKALHRKRTFLL